MNEMEISTLGTSFVLIQLCLIILNNRNNVNGNSYTAGVVEFAPEELLPTITPQQHILSNADKYNEIIEKAAAHGVDILVFPEYGLTGHNVIASREKIRPYAVEISVGANPCNSKLVPEVLIKLSCAARDKKLYLVVNLGELVHCDLEEPECPSDGTIFYNTDIAFNRDGTIISKYRKFNLYREPAFSVTPNPEHSWFDTDFGVRFGIFICADILYPEPTSPLLKQNISNYIFSTAWSSEFPLYLALSIQAGWALENDVNLLAAGYSNASRGLAGSGIYGGCDGTLIATFPKYTSTKLLIAKVSTSQRGGEPSLTEEFTFKEDKNSVLNLNCPDVLEDISAIKATSTNTNLVYVNGGFKCNVHVILSNVEKEDYYWLVAYSGNTNFEINRTVHIEICGVIACSNSTLTFCNQVPSLQPPSAVLSKIDITSLSKEHMISFPVTLGQNLLPLNMKTFKFVTQEKNDTIEMSMSSNYSLNNVMSFLIFRFFDKK